MNASFARKMGVDATQNPGASLTRRVQDALNGIRPALQMDGGDCELLEISPDGTAKVLLKGTCTGCPSSSMTVTMGIERRLKASVPEITRVVAV
jgi:Fe-S cluster biogenesis protein NfuA